jgi:hypothetical protein
LLAYVLWHWTRAEISTQEYASRQRAFHAALASSPSNEAAVSASLTSPHNAAAAVAAGGGRLCLQRWGTLKNNFREERERQEKCNEECF